MKDCSELLVQRTVRVPADVAEWYEITARVVGVEKAGILMRMALKRKMDEGFTVDEIKHICRG